MEETKSEMETSDVKATNADLDQSEQNITHDISNDLDETDKLQISSDLADNGNNNDDDDDEIISSVRSKKKNKVLDSDGEGDEAEQDNLREEPNDKDDVDSVLQEPKITGADSSILDKEESDPEENGPSPKGIAKKRYKALIDSDSEPEDLPNEELNDKQKSSSAEMENDSDDEGHDIPQKSSTKHTYKSLIDSDTESESEAANDKGHLDNDCEASQSENDEDRHSEGDEKKSNKQKKDVPMRMSAKQAMEQMRSIKSESQRLCREGGYITIPYHEPKQFSLKEFMNRKTIVKPTLKDLQKPLSLKMSSEELEEFAMKLKEREEEAKKFFKSDERRSKGLQTEEIKLEPKTEDVAVPCASEMEENTDVSPELDKPETVVNEKADIEEEIRPMETDQELPQDESMQNIAPATESQSNRPLESEELFPTESVIVPETEESQKDEPVKSEYDFTPKLSLSESVNEVLKERNVVESPVLKGSPNMLIDLESGEEISPTPTGAQKLFERFLKHSAAKRKGKESTNMSIVSTENGVLEITNVTVAVNEEDRKEEKPGAAYFKLQDNLRKAIMQKRKEEFQKRVQHTMDSDKENEDESVDKDGNCIKKQKYLDEEQEMLVDEDENLYEEDDAVEDDEEDEQNDENDGEENEKVEDVENDEADDEYESDEEKEEDDGEDDDDDELAAETKLQKKRIIKAFDDSDDESQQTDSFNINLIDKIEPKNDALWKHEPKTTLEDEEDELLGLCSGRFDPTQKASVISQVPTTIPLADGTEESELLALCSGTFQTQAPAEENPATASPLHAPHRLESSDDEAEMESEMKKPKSKDKKKMKKLGFSDDEEENTPAPAVNDDDVDEDEVDADKGPDIEPEVPETYVDYDSEENEIEVKMTKTERKIKARNEFVENEAELSESEWGSADEDEKDLDRYDIDNLADEEEFDKDKLQTELGQIHIRRVLDDDLREVKKLTEMFFEDEENDGVGRQRQFKWASLNGKFDLETGVVGDGEEALQDGELEGDEAEWRKRRFEREQLLQEQASKLGTPDITLKPVINTSVGKKLTIVDINSPTAESLQKSSPFLITKGLTTTRGSFLVRDDVTLSKLASITKLSSGEQETGAVQIRTAKAKNFVFAAISSDQTNPAKRKLDNTDNDTTTSHTKKLKTATKRKIRLIDHLA